MRTRTIICLLLLVGLLSFLFGCASVQFNPETGEVKYSRIGDQHIQGFELKKTETGYFVSFKGQQSNAEALTEALRVINALAMPASAVAK